MYRGRYLVLNALGMMDARAEHDGQHWDVKFQDGTNIQPRFSIENCTTTRLGNVSFVDAIITQVIIEILLMSLVEDCII